MVARQSRAIENEITGRRGAGEETENLGFAGPAARGETSS
jgi:hypothetical protein